MNNIYFPNETPKKSGSFIAVLVLTFLFSLMGMGVDLDQYLQHINGDIQIPNWYFWLALSVDILLILSLILVYFYRKIGVFMFILAIITHFSFHLYYLNTFLYSDVMTMFIFIGIGLLFVIPKWQFFK